MHLSASHLVIENLKSKTAYTADILKIAISQQPFDGFRRNVRCNPHSSSRPYQPLKFRICNSARWQTATILHTVDLLYNFNKTANITETKLQAVYLMLHKPKL